MLFNFGANFVDPRGKLLPRSFDILGDAILWCFIQKCWDASSWFSSVYKLHLFVWPQVYTPPLCFRSQIQISSYRIRPQFARMGTPHKKKQVFFLFWMPSSPATSSGCGPNHPLVYVYFLPVQQEQWPTSSWRQQTQMDEDRNGHVDANMTAVNSVIPESDKGILGPGPADLRFTEPSWERILVWCWWWRNSSPPPPGGGFARIVQGIWAPKCVYKEEGTHLRLAFVPILTRVTNWLM